VAERGILGLVNPEKLKRILSRMLDETEFFGSHGIRSVSRCHKDHRTSFVLEALNITWSTFLPSPTQGCLVETPTGAVPSGSPSTWMIILADVVSISTMETIS
jgi:hypothetical protein